MKKPLTSSNPESCMNFDDQQTNLWKAVFLELRVDSRVFWSYSVALKVCLCFGLFQLEQPAKQLLCLGLLAKMFHAGRSIA